MHGHVGSASGSACAHGVPSAQCGPVTRLTGRQSRAAVLARTSRGALDRRDLVAHEHLAGHDTRVRHATARRASHSRSKPSGTRSPRSSAHALAGSSRARANASRPTDQCSPGVSVWMADHRPEMPPRVSCPRQLRASSSAHCDQRSALTHHARPVDGPAGADVASQPDRPAEARVGRGEVEPDRPVVRPGRFPHSPSSRPRPRCHWPVQYRRRRSCPSRRARGTRG